MHRVLNSTRLQTQFTHRKSQSVSWAGVTVVERTLALMQEALEVDPEWEYFVNIGQVRIRGLGGTDGWTEVDLR